MKRNCLSFQGPRIALLRQAATLFLRTIVEDTTFVGIVKFSGSPSIVSILTEIDGEDSREGLVQALPDNPGGYTNICPGIVESLEVKKNP